MIRLLADLQKFAAEDGTIETVRDGEAIGDGLGGSFQYLEANTDADEGATVGTNVIKPTAIGADPGAWVRIPSKGDQNAQDIQVIKNQLAKANSDISNQIDQGTAGLAKSIAVLTQLTASGTISRANAFIKLGVISTNQTATLPDPTKNAGKPLTIYNSNTGAGIWSFSGTVKRPDGTTITTTRDKWVYEMFSDGVQWIAYNAPPEPQNFKPTTGQTVNLVIGTTNVIDTTASFTLNWPTGKDGDFIDTVWDQVTGTITYTGATVYQQESGSSSKKFRRFVWFENKWK